jgi:hypothetical protein
MTNDRFEEIEEFLQLIAQKAKEGQELEVYDELCNYGLKPEEIDEEVKLSDISKEYDHYARRNATWDERSSVHHQTVPDWFLHKSKFLDSPQNMSNEEWLGLNLEFLNPIPVKLYIPANSNEIQDVAIKVLFKFIKDYIVQESKISKKIRSDNFVSRVYSKEEVDEILSYINENCSEQIRATNPFMTRCGKVGLAMDDSISYNFMVSKLIDGYLKTLKEGNELDNVSGDGLSQYVKKIRETIFTQGKGISEFAHDRNGQLKEVSDVEYLYSSKIVMDLLVNSLDKEKTVEDFMKYW